MTSPTGEQDEEKRKETRSLREVGGATAGSKTYFRRCEHVDHQSVAAGLVDAAAQLRWSEIVRRAAEAQTRAAEEQRGAQVHATRADLLVSARTGKRSKGQGCLGMQEQTLRLWVRMVLGKTCCRR